MGDHGEPAGAAAQAIQAAELSLARQNSAAAQVDLHVVAAILNAHTARADGAGDLARLQSEIESAVSTRTDLDTPAGARAFQHYLLSRLRDIRAVVETAELDATSKATLSAALAALYASATPSEAAGDPFQERWEPDNQSPVDLGFDSPLMSESPASASAGAPAPSMPSCAGTPTSGGALPTLGSPGGLGSLGGLGSSPGTPGPLDTVHDRPQRPRGSDHGDDHPAAAEDPGATAEPDRAGGEEPDPELAGVIAAAVAGTPVAEAFAQQGITIPPAGSPVTDPIDPAHVAAGDVGILTDRYALALGNGKALLDNMIQPVSDVGARGLLGWLHPVRPAAGTSAPVPPSAVPAPPTA